MYVFQCYKIINHVLQSETSATVADYTVNEAKLETTNGSKYLGVIIQSELKFTTHIKQKVPQAKQQLGKKKRALRGATTCVHNIQPSVVCMLNIPHQYGALSSSIKCMTLKWFSTVPSGLYVT